MILATPAYVTGALVRDVDAELARLCDEIPYASTATIVLGFRRADIAHPLNGSGFVVPRAENSGILAGSWMSSKWPHRAPAGMALLRTFVGGARDPRALESTDEELVRRSLAALTPLIGLRGDPLLTRVYRWERSTAQHEVGHAARDRSRSIAASRGGRASSSPAVDFAASASPTASPTVGRRPGRWRTIWRRRHVSAVDHDALADRVAAQPSNARRLIHAELCTRALARSWSAGRGCRFTRNPRPRHCRPTW